MKNWLIFHSAQQRWATTVEPMPRVNPWEWKSMQIVRTVTTGTLQLNNGQIQLRVICEIMGFKSLLSEAKVWVNFRVI